MNEPVALSAEAQARLARAPTEPLRPPPIDDRPAVARWRAEVHAAWLEGDPPPEACGHRPDLVDGVRVLRTGPPAPAPPGDHDGNRGGGGRGGGRPLIIYCHGGGYALGSPEVAIPITERLAAGADVVSVDYRLAPEHPFPAALDDVERVHRALVTASGGPIVLAGDSAGANLALGAAIRAREEGSGAGRAPVAGLILLSPHLDHRSRPESAGSPHRRSDVDAESARWLRRAYCGPHDPDDPEISPLLADHRGLPPILIQAGSDDTARGDAERLAARARGAGVDVTLEIWPGLWHTWHYHRDLPEADAALGRTLGWLGETVDPG